MDDIFDLDQWGAKSDWSPFDRAIYPRPIKVFHILEYVDTEEIIDLRNIKYIRSDICEKAYEKLYNAYKELKQTKGTL